MARLADSETALWRQAEQLRRLREQYLQQQRVIAALARRQAGVLVIDPAELAAVPSGAVVVSAERPDGFTVLRVETGERRGDGRAEPGREG